MVLFGPPKSTKLISVDIVCVQLEFCCLSYAYQNVNLHLQGLSFLKTKDGDSWQTLLQQILDKFCIATKHDKRDARVNQHLHFWFLEWCLLLVAIFNLWNAKFELGELRPLWGGGYLVFYSINSWVQVLDLLLLLLFWKESLRLDCLNFF